MLIAAQKHKDNIAEYVLYMWHLEDMVRASKFSMEIIKTHLIAPQTDDPQMMLKAEQWYGDLMRNIQNEGIADKGHLGELNDILIEMLYLHNSLINVTQDKQYVKIFDEAQPYIKEFNAKSNSRSMNPVETALNGQYAKLLLRIQKKEITPETEEAFDHFRKLLGYLSVKYKEMKSGAYTGAAN